jgi:two-component system LytT family sensor kinase
MKFISYHTILPLNKYPPLEGAGDGKPYFIQIPHKNILLLFQSPPLLFYGFSFAIITASLIKIKLNIMKKIIVTFLIFMIALTKGYAQKSINFYHRYAAGGKLLMCVDSAAKNVNYNNVFPNQPNTSFNYLLDVNNASIQIYFGKEDNIQHYRYTLLIDDKPMVVNKSFSPAQFSNLDMPDEELRTTSLGVFPVKGKTITTLIYSIEKPLAIEKSIFYGKRIPQAKIKGFAMRYATDKGVEYNNIKDPNGKTNLNFNKKHDELTIVKDRSDFDYLYYTSIIDKQTNKIIFESTAWQYGGFVEDHELLPYLKVNKSVFKKSGNYELIIQPFLKNNKSPKDIENYTSSYTLNITLEIDNYTQKELLIYGLMTALAIGVVFLGIFYFIKKRNTKKLADKEQQKNTAKLQLNSIRSQLNPHFLFNALSGIQNLMNKNEIDNANQYLSKFARLTRNVLDNKELISLAQEKTLLDDYLQMEQLRFGFQYEIDYTENLDLSNTEIPSMLLQPFVENAVKHGISQKASEGKIMISFKKQANDLVLTLTDNGKGFDTNKKYKGLGLQLSDSRIELLNSIYKENRVTLAIQASGYGTSIRLTLTAWLT